MLIEVPKPNWIEVIDGREVGKPGYIELLDEQEMPKPMGKKDHARIQKYLVMYFNLHLSHEYEALPELNVVSGETTPVPDVVIVDRKALYVNGDLAEPPRLTIEITSPKQSFGSLMDRCRRLLKAGTPESWIIRIEQREAWLYTQAGLVEQHGELVLALPTERIVVDLGSMWRELDD